MSRLCRLFYWSSVLIALVTLLWSYAYLPTELRWGKWLFSKEMFFYAALGAFFVLQLIKQLSSYMCRHIEQRMLIAQRERGLQDLVYLMATCLVLLLSCLIVYVSGLERSAWATLHKLGALIYVPIVGLLLSGGALLYRINIR